MFEAGNLCKVIKPWGYGGLLKVGDKVVIKEGTKSYSVLDLDSGGGYAWVPENCLELISKGGTYLIKQCKENYKKTEERNRNIDYIKENYPNIPTGSFNVLLQKIGYDSAFNYNGEYYAIFMDVQAFLPVFNAIFANNLELALNEIHQIIKTQYVDKYKNNIKLLYDEVWASKGEIK